MKKQITLSLALLASLSTANAGGYLTNTNQHIAFLRNPARNASTGIDALYSNPAGAAFLPEGWHLSLNLQSAYQKRNVLSTFPTYAANADGKSKTGERLFEGSAAAPIIPSLFAAYKTGKWTFGLNTAVIGGGGRGKFESGLPTFEAPISLVPSLLTRANIPANQYQYETYVEGKQYVFGLTLGAAYRINENLSVYGGLRAALANNSYLGYARNIQANIGGQMQSVPSYLQAAATQASAAAAQYTQAGNTTAAAQYTAVATTATRYAAMTADKSLDLDQSGFGIAPIIGVNYKLGDLHLAAKYEFRTAIQVTNKANSPNTTGIADYNDGVILDNDIPALLSLGAQYSILENLRVSAGYHHYFDKQAKMASGKQALLQGNTNEYLLGVEYDLNTKLTLSAGGQLTAYGQSDAFQSDLSFHNDSYSIGLGLAYKLNDKLTLNAAYFFTNYQDYSKTAPAVAQLNPTLMSTNVYKRTNQVFGLGMDLSL